MKVGDLRNTLNFYNRNVRVMIRVGRKEYEVANTEMYYYYGTNRDLDNPKEEQIILLVAKDE